MMGVTLRRDHGVQELISDPGSSRTMTKPGLQDGRQKLPAIPLQVI
jgi:hypothetical protein